MFPPPTKTLTSISINGNPSKISYFAGESFDPTGVTVTALFDDDSDDNVTFNQDTTYTPDPLAAGTTSVTVSYTYGNDTVTKTIIGITVAAVVIEDISINTEHVQKIFALGEAFNYDGLEVTVNRNNGSVTTTDFVVSELDTMVLGTHYVTVSFEGKTATYMVQVTNEGANVGSVAFATDLIISEYLEGSSNNKALEIFNGTGTAVDLTDYKLVQYSNGSIVAEGNNVFQLAGTLAHGETFVIVNNGSSTEIKALANHVSTTVEYVTSFNGDDAIGLLKSDELIDVFGVIGNPKDTKTWENNTYVRKATILSPVNVFNTAEWDVKPIDTISFLGSHGLVSSDITPTQQAMAFANYVMTEGEDAEGICLEKIRSFRS